MRQQYRTRQVQIILFPYAGANLIRFYGIQRPLISAPPARKHPDKTVAAMVARMSADHASA